MSYDSLMSSYASQQQPIQTSGIDFNNEDQLYQLAQMQGGAVAANAAELSHANTGILSTIGSGFKSAFKGFVDAISIPSEIIAGAVSSKYTIGEAIDNHLTMSRALFGDTPIFGQEGQQTTMQKIGGFVVRAPFDILGDPLTYVTGGFSVGTKLTIASKAFTDARELVAGEIAAKQLVGKDATAYEVNRMRDLERASEVPFSTVVTPKGQDLMSRFATATKNGVQNDFVKNEAIRLVNQSADEFGKPTLALEDAMKQAREVLTSKSYRDGGSVEERLIAQTLDTPIDTVRAAETFGNMLARKPALYESMMAKGMFDQAGLKFMGRTILSAQRIDSVKEYIPLMHATENLLTGVRVKVFGLNPLTKEFDKLKSTMADVAKSRKNEAVSTIANIIHENGLTSVEADLVTAAIEGGKMPIEPTLRDIYLTSLGVDTQGAIINGDAVAQTVRQFQKINKMNLQEAHDHGIAVSKTENYMMHLADLKNVVRNSYQGSSLGSPLKSSLHAELQKFMSIDGGEAKFGRADFVEGGLERYDPNLKVKALNSAMAKLEDRYGTKIDDIHTSTIDMQEKIQSTFAKMAEQDFVKLVEDSVPGAKGEDIQSAARVFKDSLPNLDFTALKKARQEAIDTSEKGVGELLRRSPEKVAAQINKIFKDAERAKGELPGFASGVNSALRNKLDINKYLLNGDVSEIERGLVVTETNGVVDAEARQFISELRKTQKAYSEELIKSNLDDKTMSEYMGKITDEFNQNPVGVKHMINSLLGKESKLHDLVSEFSDKRFALLKELDTEGKLSMMDGDLYRSKAGEIFRASRATIVELRNAGFNIEQNSLPIMVHSSINTVKATVSKEFLESAASRFGKLESEATPGMVEINLSALKDAPANLSNWLTGKNGEKILFHPEIAKRIENFTKSVINDEDINDILKAFDSVTRIFKASVTSIFPAFHGRNHLTNVMNSYLDIGTAALNPARNITAASIARSAYRVNELKREVMRGVEGAQKELWKELNKDAFTDRRGYTWTMGNLQQVLKDKNVALGNQFSGRIDVDSHIAADELPYLKERQWPTDTGLKKGGRLVKQGVETVFDKGQKFGQMVEDHSRMIHFLEHLDKTGDVTLAADRTKMFLFDYGELSNFEREYMKRIVPFYTWIKKNVELQARTLVSSPGKIGQEVHVFDTLNYVMSDGHGLTDDEYNKLPDYMKSQFNIVTSRNGNRIHTVSNIGDPLEAAFNAIQPSSILTSMNPLAMVPAQLAAGYDIFHGTPMSDSNNAVLLKDAPQSVKDLVGLVHYTYTDPKSGITGEKYSALNPKMFFFLMNQPFGSLIFKKVMSETSQVNDGTALSPQELLKNLTGMTSSDLDMDALTKTEKNKRVAALQDMLDKAGVISKITKQYNSKNVTPDAPVADLPQQLINSNLNK